MTGIHTASADVIVGDANSAFVIDRLTEATGYGGATYTVLRKNFISALISRGAFTVSEATKLIKAYEDTVPPIDPRSFTSAIFNQRDDEFKDVIALHILGIAVSPGVIESFRNFQRNFSLSEIDTWEWFKVFNEVNGRGIFSRELVLEACRSLAYGDLYGDYSGSIPPAESLVDYLGVYHSRMLRGITPRMVNKIMDDFALEGNIDSPDAVTAVEAVYEKSYRDSRVMKSMLELPVSLQDGYRAAVKRLLDGGLPFELADAVLCSDNYSELNEIIELWNECKHMRSENGEYPVDLFEELFDCEISQV